MVDRTAQVENMGALLRENNKGLQAALWTALPGLITKFTPGKMTCEVQPAIMATVRDPQGDSAWVKLPLLVDCPVIFPGGGGYTLTFPVKVGDECLVIFASRCIDAWWQSGGVGVQAELRMHDLSDGFVLVGPRSTPRVLASLSTTDVSLRSDDNTARITIDGSKNIKAFTPGTAEVTATGGIILNGNVTINGTLSVSGTVTGASTLAGTNLLMPGARTFLNHRHDDVSAGVPGNPPMSGF